MTTTPEAILARFAAEYRRNQRAKSARAEVTLDGAVTLSGAIKFDQQGWWMVSGCRVNFLRLNRITRIDYSNARYRGAQPLWEREE